jgi:ribosomal protein L29
MASEAPGPRPEPLGDEELAAIEARSAAVVALSVRLRRAGPAGSPHVGPAAIGGWLDDICGNDVPRLAAEIRRLHAEIAYLRMLQQHGGTSEAERLRVALQTIATATWKTWFADEAAQAMVQQARWALGDED